MSLKLWKLEQTENLLDSGYFNCCVVASVSEEMAKKWHPANGYEGLEIFYYDDLKDWIFNGIPSFAIKSKEWASSPDRVKATLIGEAADFLKEGSVICTSFNAGVI